MYKSIFDYRLGQSNKKLNNIGNKAQRIHELLLLGFNTPPAYVITPDTFNELIDLNGARAKFDEILNDSQFSVSKIVNLIEELIFSEDLLKDIESIFNKFGGNVAVRSSSKNEDSLESSLAGVFKSYYDLNTIESILQSIKLCWISSFSNVALKFQFGTESIPIILQKSIFHKYSGVAFGCDPITGDEDKIIVSGMINGGDAIVSGMTTGAEYTVLKKDMAIINSYNSNYLDSEWVLEIAKKVIEIESKIGFSPIDIEWVIDNSTLNIIQVRPILLRRLNYKPAVELDSFISSIDISEEDAFKLDLDKLNNIAKRWYNKKSWARNFAMTNGVKIPNGIYYKYHINDIKGCDLEKILDLLKTEVLVIDRSDNDRTKFYNRADLLKALQNYESNDGFVTLRIRELPNFNMSGFSAQIDDEILIEVIPGAFSGIYKYGMSTGFYNINHEGEIVTRAVKNYDYQCIFDSNKCEFVKKCNLDLTSELDASVIERIYEITQLYANAFSLPRLEWVWDGNEVVLFDLSFEKSNLKLLDRNRRVLSYGDFCGNVFIFDKPQILTNICGTHTVSVEPEQEFFSVKNSKEVQDFVKNSLVLKNKSIIIAKNPLTEYALIMDQVSGFIFEEGSLLCHLGIMLRERNIPAIIMTDAISLINDDAYIYVENGEIRVR